MDVVSLLAPMVPVLLPVLVLPFVLLHQRRQTRAEVGEWRAAAERLDLRHVMWELPFASEPHLEGRTGSRGVRIERFRVGKHEVFTRLVVEGNTGVTLKPEEPAGLLPKRLKAREIELGDSIFDAAVEVHGAPERVRAVLDSETRAVVMAMLAGRIDVPGQPTVTVDGSVTLVDGNVHAVLPHKPGAPLREEIVEVVTALLQLAQRFHLPLDVAGRLAAAIEREPLWRVRLQGLQLLSTGYPKDPATVTALRRALGDERDEIRLHAAIALGEEARPVLLAIASGESTIDPVAAHAVHALGDRLPAETASAVLTRVLRIRRLQTASACIHTLGRVGGLAATGILARVLATEEVPLAVAAAQALGGIGAPAAEGALLDALERGVAELKVPLIEALGRVGSSRAVLPIQEAARGSGEVRRAARQAIAEIQGRLRGATPGQLSIAEGDAGQLSLADEDPRGRVSLPAGT